MFKINPYMEVMLAGSIWGLGGMLVKIIDLPPTTLTFVRCAFPVLILGMLFYFQKTNPFHGNWKQMLAASVLNAARMYLFFFAFIHAPISQVIVLLYTWPIFATVYAVVFLKEVVTWKKAALIALAFSGILAIYITYDFHVDMMVLLGLLAITVHSAIYAATVVVFKKEIQNYTNWETIFFQTLVGAIVFLPFIFLNQPYPEPWQWGMSLFYGIALGLVAFGMFFSAMKKLDTATVSLLAHVEVVVMVATGVLFFKEPLTWNMLVGAVMILTSTFILTRYKDKI